KMVLHGLAGQIPEPVRDLGLQVTMGQTSCLLATQPLQRLREQPTQGTKRVLVGFQRVRLHPGLLLSRFGLRHQDRREGAPSYRSTRPWPPETQRQPPSRVGATPESLDHGDKVLPQKLSGNLIEGSRFPLPGSLPGPQ